MRVWYEFFGGVLGKQHQQVVCFKRTCRLQMNCQASLVKKKKKKKNISNAKEIQEKVLPIFEMTGFQGKKIGDYSFLKVVSRSIVSRHCRNLQVCYDLARQICASDSQGKKWTLEMVEAFMQQHVHHLSQDDQNELMVSRKSELVNLIKLQKSQISELFVVGLTDADGSFRVALSAVSTQWPLVRVQLYFDLGVRLDNVALLHEIQERYFDGKGRIVSGQSKNYIYLRIQCLKDILEVVIPFYLRNLLLSAKYFDFEKFATVAYLMKFQRHKTLQGVKQIIELLYDSSPQGNVKENARQYSKEQYLKFVSLAQTPQKFQKLKAELVDLKQEIMGSKQQN
eukprot:TRINITY_DN3125_c0_g1_i6.p1 TRINITY_DN3125_c0_g1~~TRINITY_DN3125_c0_g1_i6.p1  ORF type:complete len:339 (+),score=46.59 TRINITY_DN3125_c0_g1_i6:727-1743(+)